MHSSAALQLVHESPHRDLAAAEVAAAAFLRALGISLDSESLAGTPGRMARGYAELFTPRAFDLTTFPNDEGYDELVISRDLPLRSVCEHHMLPFVGIAHIGYLPGERIIGLSKLARVAEHFACRPQRQERLTKQIADWLAEQLQPRGVGVVIEAEHSCMTLRGVHAAGSCHHHLHIAGRPARRPPFTPGVLRTHRRQRLTARGRLPKECVMQTFTLAPQRWWVVRAFGRNPLVRLSDRVGVLLVLLASVASIIAAPVAGGGRHRGVRRAQPEVCRTGTDAASGHRDGSPGQHRDPGQRHLHRQRPLAC